jgi:signal transduction histidine kinase
MSPSLMPHAVCWRQDQPLIWTMAISNAITFLSYFTICSTLFYLARKTHGAVKRHWAFFLIGFGLFIVACGTTHLMEVVTTWVPLFWIDAAVNVITAGLSAYVAVELARKAAELGEGVNDYAARLANAEADKRRVEESLLAARKLEEWNRMSAVITHEINNPLAAIQNLLFLMQIMPDVTPDLMGLIQQSSDEVKRIESLTRSTLGFFRQRNEPEKVDLAASAEAVRFLLGPMLRQSVLELDIRPEGDCTVQAFAVETRQVLLNLTRNACEASTKGSQVTITLTGRPDDVVIEVEDRGAGIAPELLGKLFQFGVSTKGERGNGMGLWLVKNLVERHGGTVEVKSTFGKGSCFTVTWPRVVPQMHEDPQAAVAGTAHSSAA